MVDDIKIANDDGNRLREGESSYCVTDVTGCIPSDRAMCKFIQKDRTRRMWYCDS